MENDSEIKAPKAKRKYTRKPVIAPIQAAIPPLPPPIQAPAPPNPNILRLESEIMEIVTARMSAGMQLSRANQNLRQAQEQVRIAQEEVSRFEQEISFRNSLISQMSGRPVTVSQFAQLSTHPQPPAYSPMVAYSAPQSPTYQPATPYPSYPTPFDPRLMTQPDDYGRASVPADNRGLYPDLVPGPDNTRFSSAEEVRQEESQGRRY